MCIGRCSHLSVLTWAPSHLFSSRVLTRHMLSWVSARRTSNSRPGRLSVARATAGEAPDDALKRRLRESQRVEERVTYIYNSDDWRRELASAGSGLVVLEVRVHASVSSKKLPLRDAHMWQLEDPHATCCRRCTHNTRIFY